MIRWEITNVKILSTSIIMSENIIVDIFGNCYLWKLCWNFFTGICRIYLLISNFLFYFELFWICVSLLINLMCFKRKILINLIYLFFIFILKFSIFNLFLHCFWIFILFFIILTVFSVFNLRKNNENILPSFLVILLNKLVSKFNVNIIGLMVWTLKCEWLNAEV